MRYIGIDPGKTGGIAWLDVGHSYSAAHAMKMPPNDGIARAIYGLLVQGVVVTLEKQWPRPMIGKDGKKEQGAKSIWTYAEHYGWLQSAIHHVGVKDLDVVAPQTWQRAMDCMTGGDKRITRNFAIEMFPDVKNADGKSIRITHAIADALLIAEYGRRFHGTAQ